jgi:uncharacterized damage-inducible protein DinB
MCSSWRGTIVGRTNASAPSPTLCRTKRERAGFDATIVDWANALDPAWIEGDLTWHSGLAKRDVSKPRATLLLHFFNHQTHHRGQVHCLLTQAGVAGHVTDLVAMPTARA